MPNVDIAAGIAAPATIPAQTGGDSATVLNACLSLLSASGNWRLAVGVNNATDEEYPIAGNASLTTGSGYAEIAYARPREYFATLNYDF